MTLVQLVDQMAFLFVADDDFAIAPDVVGRSRRATDRIARGARRGDRARRDVRVDASTRSTLRRSIDALGIKLAQGRCRALYAAVEGRRAGAPAVRLDAPARPGPHARAGCAPPAPASDSDPEGRRPLSLARPSGVV